MKADSIQSTGQNHDLLTCITQEEDKERNYGL